MQKSRNTASHRVKKAINFPSIFGCKKLPCLDFFAIVTAFAVSLLFLAGLVRAHAVQPYSVSKMFGLAQEEPLVESDQTDNKNAYKEVREIRFQGGEEGDEKVFFLVNGFYPPRSIVLEGERPRIACDFYGARLSHDIGRCIKINGRFIQQIRTAIHGGKNPKVRVVLDLVPGKNYDVEQLFYRKDNLYVIKVRQGRSDH